MHAEKCMQFIQEHSPSFNLATEFIESIDPDHTDAVWQRFQTVADILPELQAWLGGESLPLPAASSLPVRLPSSLPITSATKLLQVNKKDIDVAFQKTQAWVAVTSFSWKALTPQQVAEIALKQFYYELTGAESPSETVQ